MEKHVLSKSTFIRGLQCFKSLYLYKNYYHLKDPVSPELQAVFNRGHKVGALAQQLFPGGIDCTPTKRYRYIESVEKTQELINNGQEVIYEATFQVDRVLIMLDILVKRGGKWFAYEVKSSTKISDTYITDTAIQYYVITNAGLKLEDISIVHIDNQYVLKEKLKLDQYFKKISVKDRILEIQPRLQKQVNEMKSVIFKRDIPIKEIGKHCFSPYQCDYLGYCWKGKKDAEIFTLAGLGKEGQVDLFEKGIENFSDISSVEKLSKSQKIQIKGEPVLKKDNIQKFLMQLEFPLWFLDFETVQNAVPKYKGVKPYQQIPFQYSLHKLEEDGTLSHSEFLAEPGIDPRESFTKSLFEMVGKKGSVVVYNATFEKMIIKQLRDWFPDKKEEAQHLIKRVIDLMTPFQKKDYYLPEMQGSHSIKAVLPALCKELSYENLAINNGQIAATAYNELQSSSDMFRIEEVKKNLIEYCKLDTFAMVKIYEKLIEITQNR